MHYVFLTSQQLIRQQMQHLTACDGLQLLAQQHASTASAETPGCLRDWPWPALSRVAEIAERAVLFFESLAKTGSGSSTRAASAAAGASAANPVYNLLPDCLSKLLEDKKLREEQLQAILAVLLGYVKVGQP